MFWDDIKEIKNEMKCIRYEMNCFMSKPLVSRHIPQGVLTEEHEGDLSSLENIEHMLDEIKEKIDDTFNSDDENSSINRIHDKLNMLLVDEKRLESVRLAEKTLDKFEDYMKNVDKLNLMVNEIKGLVSVTRACLDDKKEFKTLLRDIQIIAEKDRQINEDMKRNAEFALSLHSQQFKIDALYSTLIEKNLISKPKVIRKKVKKDG